jgi:WD40 repeat protein
MTEDDLRSKILALLFEKKKIKYEELESFFGSDYKEIIRVCKDLRFEELAKDIDGVGIKATDALFSHPNIPRMRLINTFPTNSDQQDTQSQNTISLGNKGQPAKDIDNRSIREKSHASQNLPKRNAQRTVINSIASTPTRRKGTTESAIKETDGVFQSNKIVFVSHNSPDKPTALKIVQSLECNEIPCWIAPRDIGVEKYNIAIVRAIRNCEVFLLVLSSVTASSEHVETELNLAMDGKKPRVTLLIEKMKIPDEFAYFIGTHQMLDAYEPPLEQHIDLLIQRLLPYRKVEPAPALSLDINDIIDPSPSVGTTALNPIKIFLSYGYDRYSEDALRIKTDLEARGHIVWYDLEKLKIGDVWDQYIEEGLRFCDKVVLLMTPYSVGRRDRQNPSAKDGYCLNEIAMALGKNKPIIPVLLAELSDGPPTSICRIQYLDMRDTIPINKNPEKYLIRFERLVEALEQDRLDYTGEQARLLGILRPISFEDDIAPHISRFTGRQWLFEEINRWLVEQPANRIFWLLGEPGVGKTAIAAYLVHYRGDVIAYHFCKRGHDEKSDARRAILSIAYQISQHNPEYKAHIQKIDIEKEKLNNAQTLFEILLINPLLQLPTPNGDRLVIIDAIDEATTGHTNEIAQIIRDQWGRTPPWLRLIITSRPEAEVMKYLLILNPYEFQANRPENYKDLQLFLEFELNNKRNLGATETQVAQLLEQSQGLFLYLVEILKAIDIGRFSLDKLNTFPVSLIGVYQQYFERQFPDIQYYRDTIRPALECICSAREPLPQELLRKALSLSNVDLRMLLDKMGSLFPHRMNQNEPVIVPFHKSIVEWLIEPQENGSFASLEYSIDPMAGRLKIASVCLEQASNEINPFTGYALRHLPAELAVLGKWDDLGNLLLNDSFIKAKIKSEGLIALIGDYDLVLHPLRESIPNLNLETLEALRLIQSTLQYPQNILVTNQDQSVNDPRGRYLNNSNPMVERALKGLWGRAFTAQNHAVKTVAVTPDGRFAISGSRDKTLKIWELENKKELIILVGHTLAINSVAVTHDSRSMISGSEDTTLKVWNLASGLVTATFLGHTLPINSVAVTPDGRYAVSGSEDTTLKIWDLESGCNLCTLSGHSWPVTAVAVTPDGQSVVSVSMDKTVKVWDLKSGTEIMTLIGHTGSIISLAVTPDGRRAVSGSQDKTLKVWDLENGNLLNTLIGHTDSIKAVAVTPDGFQVLSTSSDRTLKVWDLSSGKEIVTLTGHTGDVNAVAIAPDGRTVVSGSEDMTLKIWDLATRLEIATLIGNTNDYNIA